MYSRKLLFALIFFNVNRLHRRLTYFSLYLFFADVDQVHLLIVIISLTKFKSSVFSSSLTFNFFSY